MQEMVKDQGERYMPKIISHFCETVRKASTLPWSIQIDKFINGCGYFYFSRSQNAEWVTLFLLGSPTLKLQVNTSYNIGESVSFLRRLMTVSIVSLDGYSGRNFLHQDKMCVG